MERIDLVADLLAFIDRSPSPYHAVREAVLRLAAVGFRELSEAEPWSLSPGDKGCVVRGGGSLLAFQIGSETPASAGFQVIGAHTDSPNLRLKPQADLRAHGYQQLGVEVYGGALLHSWLDRDLTLAGRVVLAGPGGPRSELVDFARPLLRIPSLAIHLQRELRSEGLKLNEQLHLAPIVGLDGVPELRELLATELRTRGQASARAEDVLAFDLMTSDAQPAAVGGARGEFVFAPRLDNLASCHAAVTALARASASALPAFTRVVVLYDHEEVGSRSAEGAAGNLLAGGLERLAAAVGGGEPQGLARALARSFLISADMAHAVHPNWADKHEAAHRPVLGRGPVIKRNANASYASDAATAARFTALCADCGIEPQHYVVRSDLPCGSTIGPISAARVGLPCVDVGSPMLAMHASRETAASADVEPMIRVLERCFSA
jgi:aspartyl aminopeptidase